MFDRFSTVIMIYLTGKNPKYTSMFLKFPYCEHFWISWNKARVTVCESIIRPKTFISFGSVNWDFFTFTTNCMFFTKWNNASLTCIIFTGVWAIITMSSRKVIILASILCNNPIGAFRTLLEIRGAGPGLNTSRRDKNPIPSKPYTFSYFFLRRGFTKKSLF